jgi:hypothetical protein
MMKQLVVSLVELGADNWQLVVGTLLLLWLVRRFRMGRAVQQFERVAQRIHSLQQLEQKLEWKIQERFEQTYSRAERRVIALSMMGLMLNEHMSPSELLAIPARLNGLMDRAITQLVEQREIVPH